MTPSRSLLWSTLALLSLGSVAAERPTCFKTFRIAFHDFGLLYSKLDEGGIDKDIVDELARRSGCRFTRSVMPRARIWQLLQAGQLDMTTSGIPTPERTAFGYFITTLSLKNYVVARNGAAMTLAGFVADPKLRLGVIRGFTYGKAYDALVAQLRQANRVDESADFTQLYAKLAANRFQATLSQPINYRLELKQHGLESKVRILDWAPQDTGQTGGLVLARKTFDTREAARWHHLVEDMHADGTLLRILTRYLPADEASDMLRY